MSYGDKYEFHPDPDELVWTANDLLHQSERIREYVSDLEIYNEALINVMEGIIEDALDDGVSYEAFAEEIEETELFNKYVNDHSVGYTEGIVNFYLALYGLKDEEKIRVSNNEKDSNNESDKKAEKRRLKMIELYKNGNNEDIPFCQYIHELLNARDRLNNLRNYIYEADTGLMIDTSAFKYNYDIAESLRVECELLNSRSHMKEVIEHILAALSFINGKIDELHLNNEEIEYLENEYNDQCFVIDGEPNEEV